MDFARMLFIRFVAPVAAATLLIGGVFDWSARLVLLVTLICSALLAILAITASAVQTGWHDAKEKRHSHQGWIAPRSGGYIPGGDFASHSNPSATNNPTPPAGNAGVTTSRS